MIIELVEHTSEYYLSKVKEDGFFLQWVPSRFINTDMCRVALKRSGLVLEYIPAELKTADICQEALRKGTGNNVNNVNNLLIFVPDKFKTHDLCLKEVVKCGDAMLFVPKHLISKEMCLAFVSQRGCSLSLVPEEFRDSDVCWAAKNNGNCDDASKIATDAAQSEEWLRAVKMDGRDLDKIPRHLLTYEMCFEAVKQWPKAMRYVPDETEFQDVAIHTAAMESSNYKVLGCIPEQYRTKEMCLSCIKADKWAIFYVPDKFRTLDFCRMAVVDYNNDIRCVPHNIRIQLIVETLDGLHGDPYQLEYAIVPKFNRFFELRGRFEQLGI